MLQRCASREEGVLQVVVEQAADGGHVDVGEAREAAREVGGVVVRPKEAPELAIEDVLGLSSARGRKVRTASIRASLRSFVNHFFQLRADMSLTSSLPFR